MQFLWRAAIFRADRFGFFSTNESEIETNQTIKRLTRTNIYWSSLNIFCGTASIIGFKPWPAFSLYKEGVVTSWHPSLTVSRHSKGRREQWDVVLSLVLNMLFFFIIFKISLLQLKSELQTNEAYRGVVLNPISKYIPFWFCGTAVKRIKSGLLFNHAKEEILI